MSGHNSTHEVFVRWVSEDQRTIVYYSAARKTFNVSHDWRWVSEHDKLQPAISAASARNRQAHES